MRAARGVSGLVACPLERKTGATSRSRRSCQFNSVGSSVAQFRFCFVCSLSSLIIEDRPAYSNVAGAYGVWGSRLNKNVIGKWFNGASFEELQNGQYTGDLRFCYNTEPDNPLICP